ncbi:MAG: PEP-utilizing enzyme [Bdellovibrionota bacterium]
MLFDNNVVHKNNYAFDDLSKWKIINYRSINDLITAEFLHDLYNQAELQINPVRFRNTVCVIENGGFKSYAPIVEWEAMAKILGNNLIMSQSLREKFSDYLERPQAELLEFIEKLEKRYVIEKNNISKEEIFYDLSQLHFLALNQIYAINLVQFEHALDFAIKKINDSKHLNWNDLLFTTSLTKSGEEKLRMLELSLDITDKKLSFDDAIAIYNNEFSFLFCAYGAKVFDFQKHSEKKMHEILDTSVDERRKQIEIIKNKKESIVKSKDLSLLNSLADLATKLATRRDNNKALMGKVAKLRACILDTIQVLTNINRQELNFYFLNDLYNLLVEGKKLSSDIIKKRSGRIVLKREEKVLYQSEAIKLSEVILSKHNYTDSHYLKGEIASGGKVRGYVRKVLNMMDAMKIAPNEILVAYGTDFDLITGLQNCAGVVTEEGGILSHASVISRELSKPCLINVEDVMSILQNGWFIELDADNERIKILKTNKGNESKLQLLSNIPMQFIKGEKAKNLRILSDNNIPVMMGFLIDVSSEINLINVAQEIVMRLLPKFSSCIVRSIL